MLSQKMYKDMKAKTCLCGPCMTYGYEVFIQLDDLVKRIGSRARGNKLPEFLKRLQSLKHYLTTEYRDHIQIHSPCATLCMTYALSGIGLAFKTTCDHAHEMSSGKCNERFFLFEDIHNETRCLQDDKLAPMEVSPCFPPEFPLPHLPCCCW